MIISSEIQFYQFWSVLICFDPFWSILIQFDLFWYILTDLIQSDQKLNKSDDIYQWLFYQKSNFDPFWTDLIHFVKKNWRLKIWWCISMIISSEIQFDQVWSVFDPFWSNLIHSDPFWQIWFNLIKKYIRLKIWWYISMIISSEIENMEKVDNLIKAAGKCHKAF